MKACLECGIEFKPIRNQVCCGPACQQARKRKTVLEAKKRYLAKPEARAKAAEYMRVKRESDPAQKERDRAFKQTEEYKAKNRAYAQKMRDLGKDWAKKNPEKKQKYDSEYAKGHRERMTIVQREYAKKHPEYAKRTKARRRSIEAEIGPVPPAREIAKRMAIFGGCCYCKREVRLTLEHLVPLAKWGDNRIHNLFGACRKCNCSKQDREWVEWFREQPFYDPDRERQIEERSE